MKKMVGISVCPSVKDRRAVMNMRDICLAKKAIREIGTDEIRAIFKAVEF